MIVSKKHIVIFGIIIPLVWTIFITQIYNLNGIPVYNPHIPDFIKGIVSLTNFIFSPIIAILAPFILMRYRDVDDEARKSNVNLFILFGFFFTITTVLHLCNLSIHVSGPIYSSKHSLCRIYYFLK